MRFNMANIPSAEFAFLWQHKMHEPNIFKEVWQRKYPECFCDTAKYLIKRLNMTLMLDVSEEETMGINVHVSRIAFPLCALSSSYPVFLSVVNAKVRVPPILMEQLKVFNISEFPLT